MFKTFVLSFDVAYYCSMHNENVEEVENKIEETIKEYRSKKNVVEKTRSVTTVLCEGNARFIVTITSQFEKC